MDQYTIKEIEVLLDSNSKTGLSYLESKKRLIRDGENKIISEEKKSIFIVFFEQLKDPMVLILLVGAILSIFLIEILDAFIICFVVLLNAMIGTFQYLKSEKALEALQAMMQPTCKVIRDSEMNIIQTNELVCGDLIEFEAGDRIPCDIRLTSTTRLKMDESTLTGESENVSKNEFYRSTSEKQIADKHNMVFMSTYVSSGRGRGIAVNCGMNTEMGKIASLLNENEQEMTPLQKRMNELSKILGFSAVLICLIMLGVNISKGKKILETILLAISLAVAVIPEGLVAVVTIVQSLGISMMSKNHAIVRKLSAIETLGSVNIICSDKTGTLTQNKMSVVSTYFNYEFNQKVPSIALDCLGCCHNVSMNQNELYGDSSEKALVEYVMHSKSISDIQCEYIKLDEIPFDSIRKKMTTIHQKNNEKYIFSKGSIENILKQCTHILIHEQKIIFNEYERKRCLEACEIMENQALRVFAICMKILPINQNDYENHSTFLGLIGLKDPIKPEIKESIAIAHKAGIEVVMITGDSLKTALAIGKECGLVQNERQVMSGQEIEECSEIELKDKIKNIKIFARVSPTHKVRLVDAYKESGKIVAMSGDGVNDAPALKKADVGIAMGKGGSDVCKNVSDIILTDDAFDTIIKAIEAGRNIYLKIQKSVFYLLSCNLGEIITLFIASLFMSNLVVPLVAIQLLWTNLITDALPALALGLEPDEKDVMEKKPKNMNESLFANGGFIYILMNGCYIGMISLFAFRIGLIESDLVGQSMSFMVLSLSQMFHSLNCRSIHTSMFKIGFFKNKGLLFTVICVIILQIFVCQFPFMNILLKTTSLSITQWIFVFGLSISTILINEISKWVN